MESKGKVSHEEKFGRYFIAIIPPMPIYEEVQQWKNYFRDRYKSKAALNSPPHITLHMPFEWKHDKEDVLCDKLKSFFETENDFELELLDFSFFGQKTIFIQVIKTPQLQSLENELHKFCKKELNLFNARYQNLPFHPHITIAFRDLTKTSFVKAWSEFNDKKYAKKFNTTNIVLLKHTGKSWEPRKLFSLN